MSQYLTKDFERRVKGLNWADPDSVFEFAASLDNGEAKSLVTDLVQHIPRNDRNGSKAAIAIRRVRALAKAEQRLRGEGKGVTPFDDGRLESWVMGWVAHWSINDDLHGGTLTKSWLADLVAVERAVQSGRSAALLADMIRGTLTAGDFAGKEPTAWARFHAVLTACSLPPNGQIVDALVDVLGDDQRPAIESFTSPTPMFGVNDLAAMALLQLDDPAGLRGLIDAWIKSAPPQTPQADWYPKKTAGAGLGVPSSLLKMSGLGIDPDSPPFPSLPTSRDVLVEGWRRLSAKTGVDESAPYVNQVIQLPWQVHPQLLDAVTRTGADGLVEAVLLGATQCQWKKLLVESYLTNLIAGLDGDQRQQRLGDLTKALTSESADVREAGANVIGEFGFVDASGQLRTLLDDPDRHVRKAAKRALKKIDRMS